MSGNPGIDRIEIVFNRGGVRNKGRKVVFNGFERHGRAIEDVARTRREEGVRTGIVIGIGRSDRRGRGSRRLKRACEQEAENGSKKNENTRERPFRDADQGIFGFHKESINGYGVSESVPIRADDTECF